MTTLRDYLFSVVPKKHQTELAKRLEAVEITPKMVDMTVMYNGFPIKGKVVYGADMNEIAEEASNMLGFEVCINDITGNTVVINDVPETAIRAFTTRVYTSNQRELSKVFPRPMIEGIFPGHRVRNIDLYRSALTHKSKYKFYGVNYEVLEFLGDRVLYVIVVVYLIQKYGSKVHEGVLTKLMNNYTNTYSLSTIGKAIGLDKLIQYAPHVNKSSDEMIEDAFESYIGAMFIDSDYDIDYVSSFIMPLYKNIDPTILHTNDNYKELLQQWVQDQDSGTKKPTYSSWHHVQLEVDGDMFEGESWWNGDDAKSKASFEYLKSVGVEKRFQNGVNYYQNLVNYTRHHGKRFYMRPQRFFKCKLKFYMPGGNGEAIETYIESDTSVKDTEKQVALRKLNELGVKIPTLV